jgi:hypothetical protein
MYQVKPKFGINMNFWQTENELLLLMWNHNHVVHK